jgi:hypothetical protein
MVLFHARGTDVGADLLCNVGQAVVVTTLLSGLSGQWIAR